VGFYKAKFPKQSLAEEFCFVTPIDRVDPELQNHLSSTKEPKQKIKKTARSLGHVKS
jgi:hypothetical protein